MLFFLLVRGRYGPLVQVGLGAAFVVVGVVASAWVSLGTGGVLLVWGIATGISRLTRHNHTPLSAQGPRSRFALRH